MLDSFQRLRAYPVQENHLAKRSPFYQNKLFIGESVSDSLFQELLRSQSEAF